MLIVFNIIVVGLVLLIGYWWANQGLFSAILQLLCVLVAGAIALGVWEPLVVGVFLKGGWFDNYAWGISLVGVFVISLFILRQICDRVAPANVELPHWADLTFGFPCGVGAGIISVGIVLLGSGFLQSHAEIMGYRGYGPDDRGKIVKYGDAQLWLPASQWTAELYSWLSVSSMWTPSPMHHENPLLHRQASLLREAFKDGMGQISLPPNAAQVESLKVSGPPGQAAVSMSFLAPSLDFGEQLTISASQIRLVSDARGKEKAKVVHPSKWVQEGTLYLFDDRSHYITSKPGRESTDATIIFDLPAGFLPKYIQVKGTRFRLPRAEALVGDAWASATPADAAPVSIPEGGNALDGETLKVSNSIRPIRVSKNGMPSGMEIEGNDFVSGFGEFFGRSPGQISRALLMRGVYEPPGTKIVMLDVSRGSPADLYNRAIQDQAGSDAAIRLIDADGNSYSPMGYIHAKGDGKLDLKLVPGEFLRTFEELPYLPTSGTQNLKLYFRVTGGSTIVAFMCGDITIGRANLEVPAT